MCRIWLISARTLSYGETWTIEGFISPSAFMNRWNCGIGLPTCLTVTSYLQRKCTVQNKKRFFLFFFLLQYYIQRESHGSENQEGNFNTISGIPACLKPVCAKGKVQVIGVGDAQSGGRRVTRSGGVRCQLEEPPRDQGQFSIKTLQTGISSLQHNFCTSFVRRCQTARWAGVFVPAQAGPAPRRTPASHSARAAGDPRDSFLAKETNQPQDPGCLRAKSKARIICLALMPVGSADLEDTSRLLPAHEPHTATKTVAASQRTWQKTFTCTKWQTRRWESVRGHRGPRRYESSNPMPGLRILSFLHRFSSKNPHLLLKPEAKENIKE